MRHAAIAALLLVTGAAVAQQARPVSPASAPGPAPAGLGVPLPAASWQHAGSDIPADPAWRTGTLANGLRWAVRRNGLPAGNLSIRVRIDAGGLVEGDSEQGWAHLLEHMAFRGSATVADGEGVRIWQRLGARFGADTNAFTSLRSTTYVLDLPRNDPASLREAMRVLAEMVQSARIDGALLAMERQVVLAEGAQRRSPLARRLQEANQALLLAGTRAGRRDVLGTPETLGNATAERLRGFYKRWYRPERAVVAVVGDADPAMLEGAVEAAFGGWRGEGPPPAEPDHGAPAAPAHTVAVVADPQAANRDLLAWVARHDEGPVTVARVQRAYLEAVADGIVGQRLSTAEQAGGALVDAAIGRTRSRHVADQLLVSAVARPGQRRAALDQVFAVINGLRASAPSPAEIDQQFAYLRRGALDRVTLRATSRSGALANELIGDVDAGDVTPDPRFYLDTLTAYRAAITPDAVRRTIADGFATDPRLIRSTSDAAATEAVAAADLSAARRVAAGAGSAVRAASLDELAPPGRPGTVVSRTRIADLGIERVRFANGVTLDWKVTPFERNTVRLGVRVGHGLLGRAPGDPGLFWSSSALGQAGVGPFTRDELARLTAGRRIGFSIGTGLDGIGASAGTSRGDLPDTLRLITVALTQPRFAEAPLSRLRDANAATYQALYAQPGSVLSAFGAPLFYGGDARFRGVPPLAEIAGLTLPAFQRFWTAELARGPIRVSAVGDLDPDALVAAVARTLGALPPRPDMLPDAASLAVRATPPPGPFTLRHRGAADQASVARVFPILGYRDDLAVTRALGLAAAIVQDRLTSEFREAEAGTYAPSVAISQNPRLPAYGSFVAGAQLKIDRIPDFDRALARILADLAANGPDDDALARAKATAVAGIERARGSDNGYWLGVVADSLDDPRDVDAVRTAIPGRRAITAADVRAAAARYLTPGRSFAVTVLPEAARTAPARP